MVRRWVGHVAVLPLLISLATCTLYEDQKGSNNWIIQNVGHVDHASLLVASPAAVVSTDEGVIASINLQDGSLNWRRDQEANVISVSQDSKVVVVADSNSLNAWHLDHGQLVWTTPMPQASEAQLPAICHTVDSVFSVTTGSVSAHTISKGLTQWATTARSEHTHVACTATGSAVRTLAVIEDGKKLSYTKYDSVTGEEQATVIAQADLALGRHIAMTENAMVALSKDGTQICGAPLQSSLTSLACAQVSHHSGVPTLTTTGNTVVLRFQDPGSTTVAIYSTEGPRIQKIVAMEGISAASPAFVVGSTPAVAVSYPIASVAEPTLKVVVYDATTGRVLSSVQAPGSAFQDAEGVVVDVASLWAAPLGTPGSTDFRFLLRAADGTLAFVRQAELVWTRYESLAEVVESLTLDLPGAGNPHAPPPRPPLDLMDHLILNLLVLKSQVGLADAADGVRLAQLQADASHRTDGTRDLLGMRKLALLATASGHLVALHSGDGSIMWRTRVATGGMPLLGLNIAREPRNMEEDIEVLAIFSNLDRGKVVTVNAYTGRVLSSVDLPSPVTHVQCLQETANHRSVFLMANVPSHLPEEVTAFLFPDSASLSASRKDLHLWAADKASGAVAGYTIPAAFVSGSCAARKAWAMTMHGPLLAVQQRDASTSAEHHVKVQGDRSMRFRYQNPNMAMLVSAFTHGEGAAAEQALTVSIVDTVTGRMLHNQHHSGACGPVATAFYDNHAILQFWDVNSFRWQVAVMELYEHAVQLPNTWHMVTGALSGALLEPYNTSSHNPVTLEVIKQAYFAKIGVRSMLPTKTLHNVTPRHILMATVADSVYQLDAKLVDARRPKVAKPTAEHKEEHLVPYSPQLPLIPYSFASYHHTVGRVHSIRSSPSHLESTTHVLSWGLDVYYALLRPARGFDMLQEDFSFALLTVALLALLGGVLTMSRLVSVAKLKSKWH